MRNKRSQEYKTMNYNALVELCNELHPQKNFDIVLRCWNVFPGDKNPGHFGEYESVVEEVCKGEAFSNIMAKCRRQVDLLWEEGQPHLRVACVCDQGTHQSVAVSRVLQAVYRNIMFTSKGLFHLSQPTWNPKMCTTCQRCKPNKEKEQLFDRLALAFSTNEIKRR